MISVAITTYNGEKYIEEQLDSIYKQSMPVDEIIIADDMSSDGTLEKVKNFIQNSDFRHIIQLVRNDDNLGYTRNFYKAISMTKGDYIFLADQDDVWLKDKVRIMIATMEKYNAEILCTNFEIIDETGAKANKKYRVPDFIEHAMPGINQVGISQILFS